jgi:glycosyltransferase involved in cell wall biosynthesis
MANPERSSSLKVLIASSYPIRKERPDGVTCFITELAPYLKNKGCAVRLVGPYLRDEKNNAADFTLGRPVRVSHKTTIHESGVSFNKALAAQLAKTVKPDIVVFHEPLASLNTHTFISGIPKRADGKPYPAIIGHFHAREEDLELPIRIGLFLLKFAKRLKFNRYGFPVGLTSGYLNTIFDSMDGRIAVSDATATFWRGISQADYKVIYNGIEAQELTPNGPKIEAWQNGKKTILFAGRHDPRKGIPDLLLAFEKIRSKREDIQLKIAGEGKMTGEIRSLIKMRRIPDVELVGILSRADLVKAYRTADIFCSPARGGEGFGRVLAEALSCGTLVVGTDIEGYREVIWRGQPFARLALPNNLDDLAIKIEELLELPEEDVLRFGQEASSYAQGRFNWNTIANQTVAYYEKCLSEHGRTKCEDWPRRRRKSKLPEKGIIFDASTF